MGGDWIVVVGGFAWGDFIDSLGCGFGICRHMLGMLAKAGCKGRDSILGEKGLVVV